MSRSSGLNERAWKSDSSELRWAGCGAAETSAGTLEETYLALVGGAAEEGS